MDYIYIAVLSLGAFVTVFILSKIIGYRQMSQMSMFDYINGITIGSIAAEMATALEEDFLRPFTGMVVFGLFTFGLSLLCRKSVQIRQFVEGTPIILLNQGTIYYKNLKTAKIDVTEFLEQCRENGYFDLSKLQMVLLEGNGRMSFLPVSTERPLTPADMNLTPKQEEILVNLIMDGKIMWENLKSSGKDEKWLKKQILSKGAKRVEDVLLATCDRENNLVIYKK